MLTEEGVYHIKHLLGEVKIIFMEYVATFTPNMSQFCRSIFQHHGASGDSCGPFFWNGYKFIPVVYMDHMDIYIYI